MAKKKAKQEINAAMEKQQEEAVPEEIPPEELSEVVDDDEGIEHALHQAPEKEEKGEYKPPLDRYKEKQPEVFQEVQEKESYKPKPSLYKEGVMPKEQESPAASAPGEKKEETGMIRKPEEIRELVKTRDILDATEFAVTKKDLVRQLKEYEKKYENKEV